MTTVELQAHLDRLDDGVLRGGKHSQGREFCALEFSSQVRGKPWSDAPDDLPDVRPLNDGPWAANDRARTDALLPVLAVLWDWTTWTPARQQQWATDVVVQTVRRLVADLPGLPLVLREQCRRASTLDEAASAATFAARAARAAVSAASYAAAASAASAAASAARAARAAAASAAGVVVLETACNIWVTAARV